MYGLHDLELLEVSGLALGDAY